MKDRELSTPKRLGGGSLQRGAAFHHAPRQEKKTAARLQGKTTRASGAKMEKGDVRIKGVARIECKCTAKKSFAVTQEMILKIEVAAMTAGELPIMEIEFIDERGKTLNKVAVLPVWALDLLLSAAAA